MANWWQKFSPPQSIWLTILTFSCCGGNTNLVVQAQVIPDDTLGNEASVVNQISETLQQIEGGALRGENLFHSFLEFSINQGNAVYFSHPAEVVNIFSRVTGTNISQILGTLGVLGNANLYLLNPNGILFGPNSQLDISGSFVASSANSVVFPNGAEFSATNPQAPPLLTVNTSTPVGLKFEGIPSTITSQAELITAPQKTIALVGGEMNIEGGKIIAEDGRIELGSVGNNSIVNFTTSDLGLLALDYSETHNFKDLSLSNIASLDTSGDRGGEIQLQGQNIYLSDDTFIISTTFGTENGGNLIFNALDSIDLTGFATIISESRGEGNGGNIFFNSNQMNLWDETFISADSHGIGNAGEIIINANESFLLSDLSSIYSSTNFEATDAIGDGGNIIINSTGLIELVGEASILTESWGKGTAGDIVINTNDLNVQELAFIGSSAHDEGKGGDLIIQASQLIDLGGLGLFTDSNLFDTGATGNSGNIDIEAKQVMVIYGANINSSTYGDGLGGNIEINASDSVNIIGFFEDAFEAFPSGIFSQTFGKGNSGNITLQTRTLIIEDGASLSSSTFGAGNAGDISILETNLIELNGSDIVTSITTRTASSEFAAGDTGNITIETKQLNIFGGSISTKTVGGGNTGKVQINATEIFLNSINSENPGVIENVVGEGFTTLIIEEVKDEDGNSRTITKQIEIADNPQATGNGGGVFINTKTLSLTEGAKITTSTRALGDAGEIEINATEIVSVDGEFSDGISSLISSNVAENAQGNLSTEGILIDTNKLQLTNGGGITATTFGEGDAGIITINATESISLNGQTSQGVSSLIASEVGSNAKGNGEEITLNTNQLLLDNNAQITSKSDGAGDAGNVIINAPTLVNLDNNSSLTVETDGSGKPGKITINSATVNIGKDTQISATVKQNSTNTEGEGRININASNLNISGQLGIFAETRSTADAGSLTIKPYQTNPNLNIQFTDEGFISARTTDIGDGGSITLTAPKSIDIRGNGSITAEASGSGNAGNINLTTQNLTIDGVTISTETTSGDGGNINLTVNEFLTMRNGSKISTTAGNQQTGGNGGNINIFARYILAIPEENSDITANAFTGRGGKIFIATEAIFGIEPRDELTFLSDITASSELGVDGIIEITRLNVDPMEGLTNLPETRADVVVAQGCDVGGEGSISFYDLGKGGLPAKPGDYLIIDSIMTPWIPLTNSLNPQSWNLEKNKSVKISDSETNIILTFSCRNN